MLYLLLFLMAVHVGSSLGFSENTKQFSSWFEQKRLIKKVYILSQAIWIADQLKHVKNQNKSWTIKLSEF